MCIVKKPKIHTDPADEQKDPPVLRNPILDGMLGNIAALRGGRNSLRINLLNPLAIPVGGGSGGAMGAGGGSSGGGSSYTGGGSSGGNTNGSNGSTTKGSGGLTGRTVTP